MILAVANHGDAAWCSSFLDRTAGRTEMAANGHIEKKLYMDWFYSSLLSYEAFKFSLICYEKGNFPLQNSFLKLLSIITGSFLRRRVEVGT